MKVWKAVLVANLLLLTLLAVPWVFVGFIALGFAGQVSPLITLYLFLYCAVAVVTRVHWRRPRWYLPLIALCLSLPFYFAYVSDYLEGRG